MLAWCFANSWAKLLVRYLTTALLSMAEWMNIIPLRWQCSSKWPISLSSTVEAASPGSSTVWARRGVCSGELIVTSRVRRKLRDQLVTVMHLGLRRSDTFRFLVSKTRLRFVHLQMQYIQLLIQEAVTQVIAIWVEKLLEEIIFSGNIVQMTPFGFVFDTLDSVMQISDHFKFTDVFTKFL